MKKLSTEDCVALLVAMTRFKAWKRVSKKGTGPIERLFVTRELPDWTAVVTEADGRITSVNLRPNECVGLKPSAPAPSNGEPRPIKGKDGIHRLFYFDEDEYNEENEQAVFWIVEKSFYDREGLMDDQGICGGGTPASELGIPEEFSEDAESYFSYRQDVSEGPEWAKYVSEGRDKLLALGMAPIPKTKKK